MQRLFVLIPAAFILLVAVITLWREDDLPPIKVGILHSLTGTMAISEKPVMQATLLAIEQINAKGGLLGRKVKAIVVDGESEELLFAREAERLIVEENVSVIFGCWTSASRKMVKPMVEKYNHLLFYPLQYEGLEQSANIIYTGATPNQQIIPAVSWAVQQFGPRIYLVGSDYVFPRVANWLIGKQALALNAAVVGERYIPLESRDVESIIEEIQKLKPDVVLNTINGDSNIAFFHRLNEAGITAEERPVLSFSIGESELTKMHDDDGDPTGHFAAWNYFQSIDNQQNRNFIEAYQSRFGKAQPVSDPMQAAWAGVHLWARAVQASQTDDSQVIRQSISHQSLIAPEGIIAIDQKTQHAWKTVRIGQIRSDSQFDILWSSNAPVRPDPYPALVTKQQADAFLRQLYDGWNGHWARPIAMDKAAGQMMPHTEKPAQAGNQP